MVHDGEFLEGRGFEIADRDELGVPLDGGFSEHETALGGNRLPGMVFHRNSLVDTIVNIFFKAEDTRDRR